MSQAILPAYMQTIEKVYFNPKNKDHLTALSLLVEQNRQHPTLRFVLEQPYLDVRAMMLHKVAKAYIEGMVGETI
jgi:hypothetical protein